MSSLAESIANFREKLQGLGKRGSSGGDDGAPTAGGKFDAKVALAWAKANPVTVACVAVILVVPPTAWWFASDLRAQRAAAAEARAKEWGALEAIERVSVEYTLPGEAPRQETGVVSTATITAYESLSKALRDDARRAYRRAHESNQAGRTALFHPVTVTAQNVNLIAEDVFDAVWAKANEGAREMRIGMPPADERLIDELQRKQDSFIALERKLDRKSLDADQAERLKRALADTRLQMYADRAQSLSFYGSPEDWSLPASASEAMETTKEGQRPSEARMFGWQWRWWIIEDVLRALADANSRDRDVLGAPVKRVLAIIVPEEAAPKPVAPTGEELPPPEEGAPPADGMPVEGVPAPAFPPIDLKAPVPYDFNRTLTGRVSNSLYDVRPVTIRLVVATTRLPEVMDAIARRGFMTVTNVRVRPADAFEAADAGFIYGAEPVSEVELQVETVWLRSWLARLMPPAMQKVKGTDGRTSDDADPAAEPTGDDAPEANEDAPSA